MAVTDHEIPRRLRSLSPRDARFLEAMYAPTGQSSSSSHTDEDLVASCLNSDKFRWAGSKSLLESLEANLLTETEIEWIEENDQRILIHSLLCLREQISYNPNLTDHPCSIALNNPPYETRYENIILALDCWQVPLQEKRDTIAKIKQRYTQNIAPQKWINWLKPDQDQQIAYAMQYVTSQNLSLPLPSPGNTKEAYDYLVGLFDDIFQRSPETLELTLMKMRKGWSQQKYRQSSKAKKQVYFSLGRNAREQLDRLVLREEKSKSDIIEALILGTKDQTA
ncbi:MAG: hypothetical protein MI745_02695 [Pseudomonadales bacterium]|nr:hypothetical protein [Pseudomonadales bacterium]